ncbi:MAG: ABC transporter ATP-binding protein [Hyphomicrobiales bacterium]|nr:ABC transporter ATP-binding protein [Hyphomicrobiales bacterium]
MTEPSAPPPIIDAQGLHTYYGASHILHGVSLTVRHGESVALMGRNGMGKTTTIRSLFGLTPPRQGTLTIHGRVMTGAPANYVAKEGLALVPEGRGIFPNLTVRENLIMAAGPGKNGKVEWDFDRVIATFPRLGERLANMGDQLSGGEQQMLSIGRALMTNPDLLILDEATEGLAPLIRAEIWSVVKTIRQTGIATLIVDKDMKRLFEVCDRCVILEKGVVVYEGTAAELEANPDIHVKYLGV